MCIRDSRIHRKSMLSALAAVDEANDASLHESDQAEERVAATDPLEDSQHAEVDAVESTEQPVAESFDGVDVGQVPIDPIADTDSEPEAEFGEPAELSDEGDSEPQVIELDHEPEESAEPVTEAAEASNATPQGSPFAAPPKEGTWTSAFERYLFNGAEAPATKIETRSRVTMQCQRLLRDHHIHIAVPAKAVPRQGTNDPKGDFLIAFTDRGLVLFKPTRGNKALPRDVIGPLDGHPVNFNPADYNAREGGELIAGSRTYVIPRAYVNSLAAHIEEHH